MDYTKLRTIGGKGAEPHQFAESLRGLAIDATGRLHAVGDSKVVVFDAEGELLRSWETARPGHAVAVAADGEVYVGEAGQVEIFDAEGKLLRTWRDEERLGHVTAIGLVGEDVLFADAAERCLRRYSRSGDHLLDIGWRPGRRGFLIPNGTIDFSIDPDGVIHAANPGKHRVERYTLDDELLGHFGRFDGRDPAGFQGCCNPTNVAVAGEGRVFVTEKATPRVKVYDAEGQLLEVIADADAFDPACKNMDLVVDSAGRIHVVDTVRLEILVFGPEDDR